MSIESGVSGDLSPADAGADEVMLVRLGGSSYALPVASVREIVRLPQVTRVPGLPAFVAGLANVRGRVLAVLDLRTMLGVEAPRGDRLVILDGLTATARPMVGLIVDAALDLVRLSDVLEPLPPGIAPDASSILDGMTVIDGSPVAVLSPAGLVGLRARLSGLG